MIPKGEDVSAQNLDFEQLLWMSHARCRRRSSGDLPGRSVSNPRGLRDFIFTSGYERRVLITRKYAAVSVVGRYRCSNRLFFLNFDFKTFSRDTVEMQ